MATIVILEHLMQQDLAGPYLLYLLARRWEETGHRVVFHRGTGEPPAGDLAVLHIDVTVIPEEYRNLLGRYARVINGKVLDISKRRISVNLVDRDSDWPGPVIVKTNANAGGFPEQQLYRLSEHAGVPSGIARGFALQNYKICDTLADVPEEAWSIPSFIVEKFLPEYDERGYYIRFWMFLGDKERSYRVRGSMPIVKSEVLLDRETVAVPDEIRAWRARLGFDFGKFDYVIYDGKPVLLDTNKTPGAPSSTAEDAQTVASRLALADGVAQFLR
jgi:hypothetical protein